MLAISAIEATAGNVYGYMWSPCRRAFRRLQSGGRDYERHPLFTRAQPLGSG
jgi:hypothetical protein